MQGLYETVYGLVEAVGYGDEVAEAVFCVFEAAVFVDEAAVFDAAAAVFVSEAAGSVA